MKSPFTGKEMRRIYEMRLWKFRGEEYPYMHTAWLCEDSGEQFTDDASDTVGFIQVTNQYREKYGIPYTDGSPEAVDEQTGIVVEQGNIEALANAIRQMKESPLSSEACRKRTEEHFNKDKCFEKYIELYESLLK